MATISSNGTGGGLASATTTWAGGVVPIEGDKVIIVAGDTVTLDGTFVWGDDSVTATIPNAAVNVSGTLSASRTVSSSLTGKGMIVINQGATLDYGTTASPIPLGVTATLILNKATTPAARVGLHQVGPSSGAGNHISWSFTGEASRSRGMVLNADTSTSSANIVLTSAAHGWVAGDEVLLFNTTDNSSADENELRTISSIAGATITLNAAPTYVHKAGSPVCNLKCNVVIQSFNQVSGQSASITINAPNSPAVQATLGYYVRFKDTQLLNIGHTGVNSGITCGPGIGALNFTVSFDRVVRKNNVSGVVGSLLNGSPWKTTTITDSVFYNLYGGIGFNHRNILLTNCWVANGNLNAGSGFSNFVDCWFTAGGQDVTSTNFATFTNCTISGRANALCAVTGLSVSFVDCDVGKTYGWKAINADYVWRLAGQAHQNGEVLFKNCQLHSAFSTPSTAALLVSQDYIFAEYVDKNQSVTTQEIYTHTQEQKRDNSNIYRSTSSISIAPIIISTDCTRTKQILCANGSSIRVIGYVKKSHASNVAATVTITGLGIAAVTFTKANDTNWEKFDLTATNSSGADGNFTLTYTANSSSGTSNVVYFDGVPDAPFVTKCRHYGFLFDESNPTRTVNPYTSTTEATAIAYTGVTVDNATKEISFAAGTADTAQKFYDFVQARMCANLSHEIPLVRSGSVYALTAGWTVIDPYYSGAMTWSGGTVQYSTYGSKADDLDGCIIEFADTGGGTYTLTGNLGGTLDLRNLDSDPITVEVPTGTTTTTANNTGGAITVQEPQTYQSVVLTGGEAGSRVQLYDLTSSTELYNDIPVAWPFTWTDPSPYAADREIRLRLMWVDGDEAKLFIDQAIGTVTEAAPTLPYLIAQRDDAVYNANAIDGSALTGYAIVGTTLRIDVDDGSATWPEMYAYEVYWLSTEGGIRDQDLYIEARDTANYVFFGGFKIRNTSSPSVPLLITGGNGEPSSGPATDLLDTTGGTIFVNSSIVVPYSSGAEVTEQIVRDGLTSQGYTQGRAGNLDEMPANIVKVNNVSVTGTGVDGDTWGPA